MSSADEYKLVPGSATLQPPRRAEAEVVLGKYRLLKLLGEGSMGQVYLGQHVTLGRNVAIKVLRPEQASQQELAGRFFQEARAVNQINHEHIVQIFDFVQEPPQGSIAGRVYCVLELLEGKSFTDWLAPGDARISDIEVILQQVCSALEVAHNVGVVHRDLKPDNLFVCERNGAPYAKVLDFGVAKLVRSVSDVKVVSTTLEGALIGTPLYMSPEQAQGEVADRRSDVYSLGVVLYQAVAGHTPFQASSFGGLVASVIKDHPPGLPLTTPAGERIPPALAALVARCLSKDPSLRPQSMAELGRELKEAVRVAPPVISAPAPVPAPSTPPPAEDDLALAIPRRPVGRWLAGAGAFVLLGAAVGWLGQGKKPPEVPVAQSAAPVAAAPAPALPAVAAPPTTLTLQVRSRPAGSKVVRADTGALLGITPLSVALPRGSGELPLRVELAGYTTALHSVRLTEDASLDIDLRPTPVAHPEIPAPPRPKPAQRSISDDAVIDPFGK